MAAPRYHNDVLRAAGITYRQLDHWCRKGLLGPEKQGVGEGARREFSTEDIRVLTVLGRVSVFFGHREVSWPERVVQAVRRGDDTVEIIPGVLADLRVLARPLADAS